MTPPPADPQRQQLVEEQQQQQQRGRPPLARAPLPGGSPFDQAYLLRDDEMRDQGTLGQRRELERASSLTQASPFHQAPDATQF